MQGSAGKPVEFEAGRMNYNSETKKVAADPRQGKVRVFINAEGEKHFEWREVGKTEPEHDVFVFEGDASFSKVGKSSGRIYFLHFQSYDEKLFFWMQGKDASQDEQICKQVNDLINFNTDAMEAEPQPQVSQPAATTNVPSNLGTGAGQGQGQAAFDFQKIFSEAMKNIQQGGGGAMRKPTPNLNDILTPQFFETILQDKEFQDALLQHLPEKQQSVDGFRASLKSAQIQQAIDALDEALNSEEGMTVLMSLGFDPSAFNSARDGTDALLIALEKWAKENGNK